MPRWNKRAMAICLIYSMRSDVMSLLFSRYNIDKNRGTCIMDDKKEINEDNFYCESNISYLESIIKDIEEGNDHFEEHELIEVD